MGHEVSQFSCEQNDIALNSPNVGAGRTVTDALKSQKTILFDRISQKMAHHTAVLDDLKGIKRKVEVAASCNELRDAELLLGAIE